MTSKKDKTKRTTIQRKTAVKKRPGKNDSDPLLQARGSGKKIWADEDADTYVRRLREGWK